jgi:hypothetical protein
MTKLKRNNGVGNTRGGYAKQSWIGRKRNDMLLCDDNKYDTRMLEY